MPSDLSRSSVSLGAAGEAGAAGAAWHPVRALRNQGIGIGRFLGGKVVELDELGAVNRHFQVEKVVGRGVERHTPGFGLVQVGVHAQQHLLVQRHHLGLALGDVGLQFAVHLAGEVAQDLVHQFAHDVAHLVGGERARQVFTRHAHVQHVLGIQLPWPLGPRS
jgi:hypothetical protein